MPAWGVKTSEEDRPLVAPEDSCTARRWFFCCAEGFFSLAWGSRSLLLDPACLLPSIPTSEPMASSPYSPLKSAKLLLLASFRVSVIPNFSLYFRARFPPRFLEGRSSGAGSAFFVRACSGSCHFAIFASTSPRILRPASPVVLLWCMSMRAARASFPASTLMALRRRYGGACCTTVQKYTMPVWGIPAAAPNPDPAAWFLICPMTWRLQAGILDMLTNPPARPMSCAAMLVSSKAHKLGATLVMRVSTKDKMLSRASSSLVASSQPCRHCARSSSESARPLVVEPVMETLMTMALGRVQERSTMVRSISFPMVATVLR
mmetsp:Transcript_76715/g.153947  ORF Transcript_76715/g.153947 Transcript_76715/m.153947 type:complete len:319 (-) Transcript_76715:513-1469(-)